MGKGGETVKLRKRVVGRVALGAVLIVLAGIVAFAVKDLLAYSRPESTQPEIRIDYNGAPLPAEHWMMESYSWRYLTLVRDWQAPPETVAQMNAAPVIPDSPLDISFTFEPGKLTVSRAVDGGEFSELMGELRTPTQPGEYIYHIQGDWGWRGGINYYFKLRV